MNESTRRTFVKSIGVSAAALALAARQSRAAEGDKLTLGIIGPGGMGSNHLRLLVERSDVRIAWVCDVDRDRLATAAKTVTDKIGHAPQVTGDLRQVLDDRAVDAVFVATPDHWHAPAAILALDAGKHVYVEKPCCHNIREGRLMIDAVRRSGKTLQVGTQSRSTPTVQEAIQRLRDGDIGDVLVAKAWNSQLRGSIGHSQPSEPPANLDFDTWTGPAPRTPYRPNLLPGIWRWWHEFGCGDIGNDGVHDIDVACWGLNPSTHPSRATCIGGKCFFDDDQQFPDTQYAVFEYAPTDPGGRPKQLVFEQRIWSPYVQEGYENGAAFYGTKGMLVIGHTKGWKLYGPRNKLLAEQTIEIDLPAHHQNFFDCVRGKAEKPNADCEIGHRSATLVHLANISARVGRTLAFDPATETIAGDDEAAALVRRQYHEGHWSVPKGV
jgi:predicted dehydrogenase